MYPALIYDDEYGVVIMKIPEYAGFSKNPDPEESAELVARVTETLDKSDRRLLICDVTKSDNSRSSKKMRKWISEQASVLKLEQIAIVGTSPVIRVPKIMVAVMGQQDSTQFFNNTREGLVWMKIDEPVPNVKG